ncbi:MAG: glycosyltransferase [Thermodesulfovibrionia bacterium]|nr:glycosyltransferase [Thermodesulfovibrionia bacterium]
MSNTRLNTILILPYTHTISHVSRPLLIAKELRNRGHEVVFAGESPKIKFIQQGGFTVVPLYEPDPDILFGNIRRGKLKFVSDSEIERMIEADIALFKKVKPDIVLTDGRFTAPISTHIAGLKHAAIVNVSSTEYRAFPYIPFFEWIPDWFIHRNTGAWRSLDLINLKLEMFVFDNVTNIFKKLSKKYGTKKTITATNCLTGKDITLLADIPEYFPAKSLPSNYFYIGPLTWKSNIPPRSWWPPEKNNKPLIYITMGTTGIGDFFHKVYELFKASKMTAIITTGAQVSNMETIEGKIYVEPFIDGDLVMEQCDLVVCHGGNGTIYQALQHGKPIIGIPTIPDQKFNMRRVEALGIGKKLSWKDFSFKPSLLIEMIRSIIKEKSFYQNASKLKDVLHNYNAAKIAADIIEQNNARFI